MILGAAVQDGQTLSNLDILSNDQGGTDGSLYGLLNNCSTPMGMYCTFARILPCVSRASQNTRG